MYKRIVYLMAAAWLAWACINAAPRAAADMLTDFTVEVVMPPGADYVVMDVLDGVEARYRTMAYNDITGVYSCAGYVKAYYQAVYGVAVQNLTDTGPPSPADLFMQVEVPQKGDIIFYPSPPSRNNHSAIVKAFDGTRITLIEQDYKWAQAEGTYTYINRTIPYPSDTANPYQIWRLVFVPDTPPETVPDSPEPPAPIVEDEPTPVPAPAPDSLPDDPPAFTDIEPEPARYEAVVTIGRMAVTINGEDKAIDAAAYIENNRAMMPVRWVSYALGLDPEDLSWDETARMVTVHSGLDEVLFIIDSDVLFVNQQPFIMDCPAVLRQGRAYLPLRFLAEAIGVSFVWEPTTASVTFLK